MTDDQVSNRRLGVWNKLNRLWAIQQTFYKKVRQEKDDMTDEEFAQALVLHLHVEVSELLDAIGGPWKTHVSSCAGPRQSQVLSEVVDIVKLSTEVAMVYGVSSAEFEKAFVDKSRVVDQRRRSEDFLKAKIDYPVVLDFDGVLSEYPKPFVDFLVEESGMPIVVDHPDDVWLKANLGIDQYESLKQKYWETNRPLGALAVACAVAMVQELYDDHIPVVIVTSRDRNYLEATEHATYKWLRQHEVDVDGVYFTSNKAKFIKNHFEHAIVVVDDDADEISRMTAAGLNAVKVDSTEKEDLETFKLIRKGIEMACSPKNQ